MKAWNKTLIGSVVFSFTSMSIFIFSFNVEANLYQQKIKSWKTPYQESLCRLTPLACPSNQDKQEKILKTELERISQIEDNLKKETEELKLFSSLIENEQHQLVPPGYLTGEAKTLKIYFQLLALESYFQQKNYAGVLNFSREVLKSTLTQAQKQEVHRFQVLSHYQVRNWSDLKAFEGQLREWGGVDRPLALFLLSKIKSQNKSKALRCKYPIKLVSLYPGNPFFELVDLDQVDFETIDNKVTTCSLTSSMKRKILRKLIHQGQTDRAFALVEKIDSKYEKNSLYTKVLFWSGEPQKAYTSFVVRSERDYLFKSKLASRAYNYKNAIDAFKEWERKHSVSLQNIDEYFKRAFLAYEFRDYYDAQMIFSKLLRFSTRNKWRNEAYWYKGWTQYLQSDYAGAIKTWKSFLNEKSINSYVRRHSQKLEYWIGRAYLSDEKNEAALAFFKKSYNKNGATYYSLMSYNWMKTLEAPVADIWLEKLRPSSGLSSVGATKSVASVSNSIKRVRLFSDAHLLKWARWEAQSVKSTLGYKDQTSLNLCSYLIRKNIGRGFQKQFPRCYTDLVSFYSRHWGIPESLVYGVMRTESLFQPYAMSGAEARGLLQIIPKTARKLAALEKKDWTSNDHLFDPDVNVFLGTRYLKRLGSLYQGFWPLAIAAYNAGPHRSDLWHRKFGDLKADEMIEHILFLETRNYVKKVLVSMAVDQSLHQSSENIDWMFLTQNLPTMKIRPITWKEDWTAKE